MRNVRRAQLQFSPVFYVLVVLAVIGLCLLPFIAGASYYIYLQLFERIVPGVLVGELDLNWMRISEAAPLINTYWNVERKLIVTDGLQVWELYPAELGLSVNGYRTAQIAYEVGRFQSTQDEINEIISSMVKGKQILPVVRFDPEMAREGLYRINQMVETPPTNVSIALVGDSFVTVPGEIGYAVNIEESLNSIQSDPLITMVSGTFRLTLKPLPPEIDDVSVALSQAEQLLNSITKIQAYDPVANQWTEIAVSRRDIAGWLKVQASGEGLLVEIDEQKVNEFLMLHSEELGGDRWLDSEKNSQSIAEAIQQGLSPNLVVSYRPTTYQVQKSETLLQISWKLGFPMWKLLEYNPGLDPDRLFTGQVLIIPPKDEMLPLPVVPNKRIVINISKQRMMVYESGKQIHNYTISTGIDRSPTQPGIFQVLSHKKNAYASVWDLYMPNFIGIYEAWPGFMNGIHGLPTLSNGTQLWASILGKPASFGCIILDIPDARQLYDWAELGVVVEIRP